MNIEKVGVKVGRKIDLGYLPYMQYLDEIAPRQPAFGTRDHSSVELEFYIGAAIDEDDDVDEVIRELAARAEVLIAKHTGIAPALEHAEADNFVISSTEVIVESANGEY